MAQERLRRILSHAVDIAPVSEQSVDLSKQSDTESVTNVGNDSSFPSSLGQSYGHNIIHAEEDMLQEMKLGNECIEEENSFDGDDERQLQAIDRDRVMKEQQKLRLRTTRGSSGNNWPVADDCIFCKIIHGFAPAFKLYEDEFCICILDVNPLCYGHSLILPKGHFPSLDLTPPWIAGAMCGVVPLISNVLMEATSCDAFNMVVNSGAAAGQVVYHTHFHIVPRVSGDGLWTSESVDRKTLSTFKDPNQLTHLVRSKLSDLEG